MNRCPHCYRKIKSDTTCTYLRVSKHPAEAEVALVWHFDCWVMRCHGYGN